LIVSLSFDIFALLTVLQDKNLVNGLSQVLKLDSGIPLLSRLTAPGKPSHATKKFTESRCHACRIRTCGMGPPILEQ
jgi:hypothetical protein